MSVFIAPPPAYSPLPSLTYIKCLHLLVAAAHPLGSPGVGSFISPRPSLHPPALIILDEPLAAQLLVKDEPDSGVESLVVERVTGRSTGHSRVTR